MKLIISILIIITIGLILKNKFFKTSKSSQESTFVHGPFEIKLQKFTTKSFNMNYGKMVTNHHVAYSVFYKGKPVEYPSALQSNTGFSHLWRVYIVKDAPQPTLFAGSQSLFMITAKEDDYVVSPILVQSTDFIKFQWLDADVNQPSPSFELYMGDERTSMEHPDTLQGGEHLMVNQKIVIHIPTMKLSTFNSPWVDNYDKDGEAIAFSPDKKVIAFPGHFLSWNSPDTPANYNAILTYYFEKDKVSVLPFNRTQTKQYRAQDLNNEWFNTYFTWSTSKGETLLIFSPPTDPVMWQGYFEDEKKDYYHLFPVNEKMVEVFKQFVLDYMKWDKSAILTEKYHEYTGKVYQIGQEKSVFYLTGKENEVTFGKDLYEPDDTEIAKLVQQIGNEFNLLLKSGKHQDLFTSIPDDDIYR
jgi:hypothetical protein